MSDEFDIKSLIGKSIEEAEKIATGHGLKTRLIEQDGNPFMGSMDHWKDRINFKVAKGLIIDAFLG